jgi:hypothetical protein
MSDDTQTTTAAPTESAPAAAPAAESKPEAGRPTQGTDAIMAELAGISAERQQKAAGAPKPATPAEAKTEEKKPAGDAKPAETPPAAEDKLDEPEDEPVTTRERLALRQREAALAEREGKLKLAEAEATELAELRALRKHAPNDPLGALEAMGLTWEKVAEAVAKGRAPMDPAARAALEKAEALEKKLAAQEAARAKAEEQAGLERFRGHVADVITKGGEALEFLASRGRAGIEDVERAAIAYHARHGKAPDLAKVAALVDKHYEDEFKATAKGKRAQAALKPAPATPAAPGKPAEAAPTTSLNNGLDGRPPAAAPGKKPPSSYAESILSDLKEIQAARGIHE